MASMSTPNAAGNRRNGTAPMRRGASISGVPNNAMGGPMPGSSGAAAKSANGMPTPPNNARKFRPSDALICRDGYGAGMSGMPTP